jgi:predicted NBD/HSP70 family sugar kinase
VEAWISGPGMAADHQRHIGEQTTAASIAQCAQAGDVLCQAALARWHQRLARALAGVINLLDPDVIVLGGGLSRIDSTYEVVPALWSRWVFAGGVNAANPDPVRTLLRPALHGDASGVRGAAWLMWKNALPRRAEAWPEAGRCCKREAGQGIRRQRAWR